MRMDVISKLKRQHRWVFLITATSITALIALARILNPSPPAPLWFFLLFWFVAMVVTAVIIQTVHVRLIRMATELENANVSLRTEIAERERVEEALRESEERYRNLFENANDAIVTFTLEGTVTSVNRGLEAMLGWSREELIGQHYRKFVTPASVVLGQERTRRFLAGERLPSIFEGEQVRKDGSVVPVEVRTRAIRDREGRPIGLQGIYRDISARKALERQRADFLAMLTHDIRNPLSVILGYTEMLREGAREQGDRRGEDLLNRIESSALTIHSLVSNYLDLSKIEAGQLNLAKRSLALNDILSRVGRQYESESHRRHLTLEIHLQKELPRIEGDPVALERVFANLLHNGLKFTPERGRVTIISAQQNREVMAAISDTGPGMAAAEIPLLFEKYWRAEHTKPQEGAGLGLFIVKALVEAHSGRVEVASTPGVGTCFSVFLPVTAAK
jgi:two-component system sensor histidine kinase/response regulator